VNCNGRIENEPVDAYQSSRWLMSDECCNK